MIIMFSSLLFISRPLCLAWLCMIRKVEKKDTATRVSFFTSHDKRRRWYFVVPLYLCKYVIRILFNPTTKQNASSHLHLWWFTVSWVWLWPLSHWWTLLWRLAGSRRCRCMLLGPRPSPRPPGGRTETAVEPLLRRLGWRSPVCTEASQSETRAPLRPGENTLLHGRDVTTFQNDGLRCICSSGTLPEPGVWLGITFASGQVLKNLFMKGVNTFRLQ